jgi:hypothetical protein
MVNFLNIKFLYKAGMLYAFNAFIILHGIIWVLKGTSFAPAVYAMKLSLIPFFLIGLLKCNKAILSEKTFIIIFPLLLFLTAQSLFTPFIIGKGINKYYFTDAIGMLLPILSIFIVVALLKKGVIDLYFIEKTSTHFVVIVSIYIVIYFIASGGMKISITPETQIPLAIMFGAYFFKVNGGYKPKLWMFILAFAGCYYSLLREGLIVFGLLILITFLRKIIGGGSVWRALLISLMIGFAVIASFYIQTATNLIQTIVSNNNGSDLDGSILQRFVEIDMVIYEMTRSPISLLLGQGFGAHYGNIDEKLLAYGETVHNIHSTPIMIYFRNGIIGLFLYLALIIYTLKSLLSKSDIIFRCATTGIIFIASLLFNQYFYWNIQVGIVVGMMIYYSRIFSSK